MSKAEIQWKGLRITNLSHTTEINGGRVLDRSEVSCRGPTRDLEGRNLRKTNYYG